MAYTTRANVEEYLRITFDGTTTPTDVQVDAIVTDMDARVDRLVGTTFTPTIVTNEIVEASSLGIDRMLVQNYPLISLQTLEYRSEGDEFNPTWTTVPNNRIVGDLIISDIIVAGPSAFRLAYTFGFTTTPTDVEYLATLLASQQIVSGDDTSKSATNNLSIGSLSIAKNVGASRMMTLNGSIKAQLKIVGKYGKVFRNT